MAQKEESKNVVKNEVKVETKVSKDEPSSKERTETVAVPRNTLEKLLGRVEKLEKDNEVLKEVADKNKLAQVERQRSGGKLVKTVTVSQVNSQLVLGWSKVKDDVYFDEQGRLHEEQVVNIHFEGGDTREMDYRAFSRLRTPVKAEVVGESRDNEGHSNLKLQFADGKELEIDSKYVN